MLEEMEELFDLNIVNQQHQSLLSQHTNPSISTTNSNNNTNINNINITTSTNNSTTSINANTSLTTRVYNICRILCQPQQWECCNVLYYYLFCCCPGLTTRGLMGFRTVPSNYIRQTTTNTNNTNIAMNHIELPSYYYQHHLNGTTATQDNYTTNTNNNFSTNSNNILIGQLGGLGGHVLPSTSKIKDQEEVLYNPATLHKYSSEMRESNFLYFNEPTTATNTINKNISNNNIRAGPGTGADVMITSRGTQTFRSARNINNTNNNNANNNMDQEAYPLLSSNTTTNITTNITNTSPIPTIRPIAGYGTSTNNNSNNNHSNNNNTSNMKLSRSRMSPAISLIPEV